MWMICWYHGSTIGSPLRRVREPWQPGRAVGARARRWPRTLRCFGLLGRETRSGRRRELTRRQRARSECVNRRHAGCNATPDVSRIWARRLRQRTRGAGKKSWAPRQSQPRPGEVRGPARASPRSTSRCGHVTGRGGAGPMHPSAAFRSAPPDCAGCRVIQVKAWQHAAPSTGGCQRGPEPRQTPGHAAHDRVASRPGCPASLRGVRPESAWARRSRWRQEHKPGRE
jgi:hypothetical protein